MTPGQRALIAAELARQKPGGARTKAQKCALTHADAAARCNISARQVDKASTLLNKVASGHAAKQLLESVRLNRLSLNRAEKIARLPKGKQLEILAGASSFKSDQKPKVGHLRADRSARSADRQNFLAAQVARLAGLAESAQSMTVEFLGEVSASSVFAETAQRLASTFVEPRWLCVLACPSENYEDCLTWRSEF